jgi:hypothetical protein
MERDQLISRIKETAYLEGDFTLRSGKKSKYYMDKYLFETCPDILAALGEEFAKFVIVFTSKQVFICYIYNLLTLFSTQFIPWFFTLYNGSLVFSR